MVSIANAGFPLFIPVFAGIAVAALPLMLLETVIARRILREPWRVCFVTVFGANLVSTVVGIPLATLVLFFTGIVFCTAGQTLVSNGDVGPWVVAVTMPTWLPPYEWRPWHIALAISVLLVAYFFVSVWIEAFMARKILPQKAAPRARRWAWAANGASYGIMLVLALADVFIHWSWS